MMLSVLSLNGNTSFFLVYFYSPESCLSYNIKFAIAYRLHSKKTEKKCSKCLGFPWETFAKSHGNNFARFQESHLLGHVSDIRVLLSSELL